MLRENEDSGMACTGASLVGWVRVGAGRDLAGRRLEGLL